MRVLNFLLSLILAMVLIVSGGAAMASFAVTESVSQEAIEKAVVQTGAVDELTDKILTQNRVNMGGRYGQTMKAILKSEAMTDFFTEYTAACLQNQVRGQQATAGSGYYNEIGSDDLNMAFSKGTDECIANGSIEMNDGERQIFDAALNTAMPALTQGINYVIDQMNLTSVIDDDTAKYMETAQTITSDTFRLAAIGIAAMAALLLLILRHSKRSGLMWIGICLLLAAGLFMIVSIMLSGSSDSSGDYVPLSTRMLYVMVSHGLQKVGIAGCIIGAACLPAGILAKLIFR